ncbi:hypothetical protein HK099_007177 [Clydaea vesicula]|uniref:Alpha/beta hydrolase fold-3 domain-containing protein n=1 Tax=Clydaea vesicula TaxID=447962 RepID=A0AAD5U0B5_9FUNG|nr:hypothetical protein HK099_007177 [Clydaea vesicula]
MIPTAKTAQLGIITNDIRKKSINSLYSPTSPSIESLMEALSFAEGNMFLPFSPVESKKSFSYDFPDTGKVSSSESTESGLADDSNDPDEDLITEEYNSDDHSSVEGTDDYISNSILSGELEKVPQVSNEGKLSFSKKISPFTAFSLAFGHSSLISTALRGSTFLLNLYSHQLKTFSSGVWGLKQGLTRPTWSLQLQLSFHLLREQFAFPRHSIKYLRIAHDEASRLINLAPEGTSIITVDINIDRDSLLSFEKEASRFPISNEFPIPDEIDTAPFYKLSGEWVIPDKITEPEPKIGWYEWAFGSFTKNKSDSKLNNIKDTIDNKKAKKKNNKMIYYIHGGAYLFGSVKLYRHLTGEIAKSTGCDVFAIDYRLAPESPFPASLHDVFAGYLYLTNPDHPAFANLAPRQHSAVDPDDIIIMGDSAGGGLTAALMCYLKNFLRWPMRAPMIKLPSAVVLFSPWLDLGCCGKTWETNADYDWLPSNARLIHKNLTPRIKSPANMYVFGYHPQRNFPVPVWNFPLKKDVKLSKQSQLNLRKNIEKLVKTDNNNQIVHDDKTIQKVDGKDILNWMVRHPLVSPLYADLKGMPPTLVQAGSCELLYDDAVEYNKRFKEHNKNNSKISSIKTEIYCDMVHMFQAMNWLPISKFAMKNVCKFINNLEDDEVDECKKDEEDLTVEEMGMMHILE